MTFVYTIKYWSGWTCSYPLVWIKYAMLPWRKIQHIDVDGPLFDDIAKFLPDNVDTFEKIDINAAKEAKNNCNFVLFIFIVDFSSMSTVITISIFIYHVFSRLGITRGCNWTITAQADSKQKWHLYTL